MTINYGQQSLFVLFLLTLPFINSKNYSYFLSGFSYVKYSTGYIVFLNYLIEKNRYITGSNININGGMI
jgi:hypothetical protein